MKLIRPAILALVIAGAFFYFTTWRSNAKLAGSNPAGWLSHPAQVEITEASGGEGLDSEEQNNINVYRKNIPSVVNVTSRAMTFDFFYGLVPQEGQGSGFVIDKEATSSPTITSSPTHVRWKSHCTTARSTRRPWWAPIRRTIWP
jgi:hypothetical protein